jgi:hypothetical protein
MHRLQAAHLPLQVAGELVSTLEFLGTWSTLVEAAEEPEKAVGVPADAAELVNDPIALGLQLLPQRRPSVSIAKRA